MTLRAKSGGGGGGVGRVPCMSVHLVRELPAHQPGSRLSSGLRQGKQRREREPGNKVACQSLSHRGTPLRALYGYVQPQRAWFFSCVGPKEGIVFGHFCHK